MDSPIDVYGHPKNETDSGTLQVDLENVTILGKQTPFLPSKWRHRHPKIKWHQYESNGSVKVHFFKKPFFWPVFNHI